MNNPPAFPLHNHGVQTLGMHISGMTLRDYFAAKAMQGISSIPLPSEAKQLGKSPAKWLAENSYAIADAMLKEREA